MLLKIGELAKRTGLTVRTLHHYDAVKLLCPSARSDAGYRLYNRQDIERLHRIQALRRLGLSLAEIVERLLGGGDAWPEHGTVHVHLHGLRTDFVGHHRLGDACDHARATVRGRRRTADCHRLDRASDFTHTLHFGCTADVV